MDDWRRAFVDEFYGSHGFLFFFSLRVCGEGVNYPLFVSGSLSVSLCGFFGDKGPIRGGVFTIVIVLGMG